MPFWFNNFYLLYFLIITKTISLQHIESFLYFFQAPISTM